MKKTLTVTAVLAVVALACGKGDDRGGEGEGASTPTFTGTETDTDSTGSADDDDPRFDVMMNETEGGPGDCNGGGSGGGDTEFSLIWIANSPDGTVSKIDTRTGVELGRYYTGPNSPSGSPSRTSVNLNGDVAVSNRDPGGITKIAARDENCADTNNDGFITTSTGPADILPWGTDECVLWYTDIPSPEYTHGPRPTAWEGGEFNPQTCKYDSPRVWVGYSDGQNLGSFFRLDGATGAILDTVVGPDWGGSYGPYGGAVNADGDFWVTGLGSNHALRIDGTTLQYQNVGPAPGGSFYGMALDATGDLWASGGNTVNHYDVDTAQWITLSLTNGSARGIQIDQDGIGWIALNGQCGVAAVDTATDAIINQMVALPGCSVPVGISIDADGMVWVVDQGANQAFKLNPTTLQVELTVGGLTQPYTYSDMTGAGLGLVVNPPQG